MNLATAQIALKKYFGYDTFRPLQEDIVQTVFNKQDCLVLMPTGGGKSICFQIPAVVTEGVTVVVSPLISLMKDQVEALRANGIPAAFLNSSQSYGEAQTIENQLFRNELKLLYVSPEKAVSQSFISLLKSLPLNLIAIDEAHCISSWGHDFRPEYTQLGFLKQQFPNIPIIALTATADKLTRRDIIEQLQLDNPTVFLASFDRPNLSLDVRPGQKRVDQILEFIKSRPKQAGIVYCLSRKSTEELAVKLKSANIRAEAYHAQVSPKSRSQVQEDFLNDKIQVVCATVAFGMGIDKSNVRWVIHYNLPKNIEGYYQEIGRAGRDGAPADTMLFFSYADVNTYRDMFAEAPNADIQNAKLDRMMQFADAQICRRRILLNYFSENYDKDCGNCDVCRTPPQYMDGTKTAQMALSAVTRLNQEVNMALLIDVLRGSGRYEILEKGYDKIKTYGIGRNIPATEWQSYIWQLIQIGLFEIAYEDKHKLRLTPASKEVLFNGKDVRLFRPLSVKERQEIERKAKEQKAMKEAVAPRLRIKNELFEFLREFRRSLAVERGVPPYIIFSDATLGEMAAVVPRNQADMLQISGIGELKYQAFGEEFLKKIEDFLAENPDFIESGAVNQVVVPAAPQAKSVSPRETNGTEKARTISPEELFQLKHAEEEAREVKKAEAKAAKAAEPKIHTTLVTYNFFKSGMSVEEIAEHRFLSPVTISGHLVQLYEQGENIDPFQFISAEELAEIQNGLDIFEQPYKLRELYEFFGEMFDYGKIRWAIALHSKEKAA
jgi:ATP-dependent DNA helicase RecQ